MRREATGHEEHEWWVAYGILIDSFVPGGGRDGVNHWLMSSRRPDGMLNIRMRMCDLIGDDDWEERPDKIVDCMACVSLEDFLP